MYRHCTYSFDSRLACCYVLLCCFHVSPPLQAGSPSTEELVKRALNRTNTDSVLRSAAKITASARRRGGGVRHISHAAAAVVPANVPAVQAAAVAPQPVVAVKQDEFEKLPAFARSQVSLEDINAALQQLSTATARPGTVVVLKARCVPP